MPRLSAFYGIVIAMYHNDHEPPHFHARYGGEQAQVSLDTLAILNGSLPPRALRLVQQWARMHRAELDTAWQRARAGLNLDAIEPLP
ncbi:MAG: DUF4160 domain-containing protein [Candidatus Dormibacteraeota bacterium]|nr:DUF4160 domain-containing protein [Candidatus Dormibacteraeota bacterium]